MSAKEKVIATLAKLPEDATYAQILDTVEFMASVQQGLDDVAAGRVVPHEDVKRQVQEWLRK